MNLYCQGIEYRMTGAIRPHVQEGDGVAIAGALGEEQAPAFRPG